VLYAGTLEPRKNVDGLLAAWRLVRERMPDGPPLLVAGAWGWGDEALQDRLQTAAALGVRTLGRVPPERLIALLQGASVFVYPSLYEGFGLPVLEAMACGAPVVTSDRSSLPEVVGDAALLVDPSEPQAIAEALLELLRSPRRARALATRGLARSRTFTWRRAADSLAALFDELLAPSGDAGPVR
jgi:glycosyltransferase involved in cell wall biosynthesis